MERGVRALRRQTLRRVAVVRFEFYPDGLRAAGDEPVELLRFLHGHGFELEAGGARLAPDAFEQFATRHDQDRTWWFTDVVGRRAGPGHRMS